MPFTVKVVNDEGDPIEGKSVMCSFTDLTRGVTSTEYTDSDGKAYFDGYEDGPCKVFVDGSNEGEYEYEDGSEIEITV